MRMHSASEICVDAFDGSSIGSYATHMSAPKITPEKIRQLMTALGVNQTTLGERLGVTQPTVSRWLKGSIPEGEQYTNLLLLIEEVELTLHPSSVDAHTVPLIGFVGAGWTVSIINEQGAEIERVPAPIGAKDTTVAVQIKGDSLGPFFDGWLVFYDEVRNPVTRDILNRICVIGVSGGGVFIKKLTAGGLPGRYHLLSQFDPPMYDVEVEWAAQVSGMGPR